MRYTLTDLATRTTMASPPHESLTLYSYLGIDEEVDYGSDTNVPGEERKTSDSPVQEARPHTAPNPSAERGEANAPLAPHQTLIVGDAIITNPLDEQQQLAI